MWVVGLVVGGSMLLGLLWSRSGSKSLKNYFISGGNAPWWLAGISMVATTFAADTPLAVTELTRDKGISGNWLWWNMLAGGMLTTFFFARYWRRAGLMTDLELIEIRYSGPVASWLRRIKAVYFGLIINALVIGWVNLALVALLQGLFQLPREVALTYTAYALIITLVYVAAAGLRGVLVTDAFQFLIAMTGSILLAVWVVNDPRVGGLQGLVAQVPTARMQFFPSIGTATPDVFAIGLGSFLAYAGVQWWASVYPGAEPGGGGYVAQRILSTKNEGHGLAASLLFNVFHYAVRSWPWLLVALGSLILYPELTDDKQAYVLAIRDLLPSGWKGLLVGSFFAAYMSTISTQLNWGAGYLVNDLYQQLQPNRSEKHYLLMARLATIALALAALGVTTQLERISKAWEFLITGTAGMGLVLILRWYWWRISAWSELVATIAPLIIYGFLITLRIDTFPTVFFWTAGGTIAATLAATFLAPATSVTTLQRFYNLVQPDGYWKPFRGSGPAAPGTTPMWILTLCWVLGIGLVYGALFSLGKFLLLSPVAGTIWLAVTVFCALGLIILGRRYPIFR